MGNSPLQRISFEDVQYAQEHNRLMISTLPLTAQDMLIFKTTSCHHEINAVEHAIQTKEPILIYGKHCNDETIYTKYNQIKKLGGNVYLYTGGLFEWLLLQDIYGETLFKTSTCVKTLDLIKYKPNNVLNTNYITY